VLGPYEYAVWLMCTLLESAVLVCAFRKNALRRYVLLNVYVAASLVVSIGRYNILSHYGFTSKEYLYFYYYSDALLTIALYFALMSLYSHIFSDLNAERYIRIGTVILLSGTALFSYAVVQQSSSKLVTHFVVELSQNLYFVGLVLTYILWAAVLKMRETRTRLIQLVLSMAASSHCPGFIRSGTFRKRLAPCPPGSPWCPDDGRRHFRFLGSGVTAVFHLLLPLAHRCLLEAGSLR